MSPTLVTLITIFVVYCLAVTWQMRRAFRSIEPQARLREAKRLMLLVSLGVPIAVAFILVAW
ncbi:MAG: hypothetical protein DWI59_05010 [Chloroflexi bacterium]|nr:MAG: hypothetical protein DWI59_05010 [Chloroflexota bacterium]